MLFTKAGDERFVCPSTNGGKNWQAGAYSPLTNTMYFPLQNTCMTLTAIDRQAKLDFAVWDSAAAPDRAGNVKGGHGACDLGRDRQDGLEVRAARGTTSLVATGGGLLFGGDVSGRFRAFDQATGKVLWEVNLGSPVTGYPITLRGRRQAVRRRQHGDVARHRWHQSPDA